MDQNQKALSKKAMAGRKAESIIKNRYADKVFRAVLLSVTLLVMVILAGIFISLVLSSGKSFKRLGFKFLVSKAWDDRMTLLRDPLIQNTGADQSETIILTFSYFINDESIKPGDNLLLKRENEKLEFNWVFNQTNEKQILIYPREKLVRDQEYQVIALETIKDQNNHPLPYPYRLSFVFDDRVAGQAKDISFINDKNGREIIEEDESDLKWYGAVVFIVGTLLSSILALLISLPFALAIAIFLGEYYTTGPLSTLMQTTNELLAGIPSIIYGAWAFFFIVPLMSRWFPQSTTGGASILTASIVLAIMIIPYSASLAREVIKLVPTDIKEAAFGMGATRFSVIRKIVLPYASSGIFAGVLLAFGRALGETMAVTMVIGNRNHIPRSILDGGQTIASLIANEYGEAGALKLSSLTELGLILFMITLLFGILGRFIIKRLSLKEER